jgi:hypothetical protein
LSIFARPVSGSNLSFFIWKHACIYETNFTSYIQLIRIPIYIYASVDYRYYYFFCVILCVAGSKPGQGDGFLKSIKIRSTPSSRMGSKAGRSHVVRFYGM